MRGALAVVCIVAMAPLVTGLALPHPAWTVIEDLHQVATDTEAWVHANPEPSAEALSAKTLRLYSAGIAALPALRSLASTGVLGCVVYVCGVGDDVWTTDGVLTIDLGGDDTYHAGVGGGIGMHIDLSGNDQYLADRLTMGGTLIGIAIGLDILGNDVYRSASQAQGAADIFSAGLLVDAAGDDSYHVDWIGQGSTSTLVASSSALSASALIDLDGSDRYSCGWFCQGYNFDAAFATAMLVDRAGNDAYLCEAACQGYDSFGLAVVALIDGQGEDTYTCTSGFHCQGNIVDVGTEVRGSPWSWIRAIDGTAFR